MRIREISEGEWENFPNESSADAKWEHVITQNSKLEHLRKRAESRPVSPKEFQAELIAGIDAIPVGTADIVQSESSSDRILPFRKDPVTQEFAIGTPFVPTSGSASPAEPVLPELNDDSHSDDSFDVTPKAFAPFPGSAAVGGSISSVGIVTHVLKVIMLGDASVGKTALIQRFVTGDYAPLPYKPTVGADFYSQKLEFTHNRSKEKLLVTLQIWDTAGQERYRSLAASFYRGADVCVLVHDASRPASLSSIDSWRSDFLLHASPLEPDSFPFIYLRNKSDLSQKDETRILEKIAKQYNVSEKQVLSVSAKTGDNVSLAFCTAARIGLRRAQAAVAAVRGHNTSIPSTVMLSQERTLNDTNCQC